MASEKHGTRNFRAFLAVFYRHKRVGPRIYWISMFFIGYAPILNAHEPRSDANATKLYANAPKIDANAPKLYAYASKTIPNLVFKKKTQRAAEGRESPRPRAPALAASTNRY